MQKLIESLSINERKILPFLEEKNISMIAKKSNLDKVSVLRSLEYLENKGIVKLKEEKKKVVDVGVLGALYRKNGLPERKLLNLLDEKRVLNFKEAEELSKLSKDEFKAAIGALKRKALIDIKNGKIVLTGAKSEIVKKFFEEAFLESLPKDLDSLTPEDKFSMNSLEKRKSIIIIEEVKKLTIEPQKIWKELLSSKDIGIELIEQITPDLLRKESNWKGKRFRRYDVTLEVPKKYGGKRHFVNQSADYARKVWAEMGFVEMAGDYIQSSFWNFDALFTAQDHPVREMHDTFFLDLNGKLPNKKIVENVKKAHEKGIAGSKGWGYEWDANKSKKMVLRTHTTSLSARTIANLKSEEIPKKFFAIGKCFRNETVDWNHGFEFNQTEGIVIDENANFRHLLGYLKQFAEKMGLKKVRFRPAYFPYTEPSVEGDVWDEDKKEWVELFAAGMLRPEVTAALFGKPIPTLAWGPGIDRMIMKIIGIKDMRELYKNDLNLLRKTKYLIKV